MTAAKLAMRKTNSFSLAPLFMMFVSLSGLYGESNNQLLHASNSNLTSITSNESDVISRTIDVTKHFRQFPDLVGFRNTSLQKATTPVLAEISKDVYGKAKITRCWLNLDEMWDYRTREFDFNFKVGVDKYKDIKEKHRETWNWQEESPVHYYDYLKAFAGHSEEIILCIRRYERDILDGTLPVSMEDYKMIFKKGLMHYKKLFPNIRYVQVGNEYHGGGFMRATDEEYYKFFRLGYKAINEVNEELGLTGKDRILVSNGPPTGPIMERLDGFFELFAEDTDRHKRLDAVSWHEYSKPISETANREKEVKELLSKHGLPDNLPMFVTEHQPWHGSAQDDQLEIHMHNTAYLPKSLYFTSVYSPGVNIFPWVLYHRREIQMRFMWFDGPNEPDTKAFEMRMLPQGASMKFLSMHKGGREIEVENSISEEDLVLASVHKDKIIIQAINYYDTRKNVRLTIQNVNEIFPEREAGKMKVTKYLIDSSHSNPLTKPEYAGGIEKVEDVRININDNDIILNHQKLEENGLVLWEISL